MRSSEHHLSRLFSYSSILQGQTRNNLRPTARRTAMPRPPTSSPSTPYAQKTQVSEPGSPRCHGRSSPGDCGTGTRCPRQGHTAHTDSPAPPLPRTGPASLPSAGRGESRCPARAGRGHGRARARPHRAPSAPAASPDALAAMLTSERRAASWEKRGAANAAAAAAHAPWREGG